MFRPPGPSWRVKWDLKDLTVWLQDSSAYINKNITLKECIILFKLM